MQKKRISEVDILRGIAIICMVVYHFMFTYWYFSGETIRISLGWEIFQKSIGITFLLLVGISLHLSSLRSQRLSSSDFTKKYVKRGVKILLAGMVITIASALALEKGTIYFGVLHLIGASILLSIPLLREKREDIIFYFALLFFFFGLLLEGRTINTPLLLWLGLPPLDFYSFDYYPIFPWTGFVFMGLFFGRRIYPKGKGLLTRSFFAEKFLTVVGRHSLIIYFLHQPLIIGFFLLRQLW